MSTGSFVYFADDLSKWAHEPTKGHTRHYGFLFNYQGVGGAQIQLAFIRSYNTTPPDYSLCIREKNVTSTYWTEWVTI